MSYHIVPLDNDLLLGTWEWYSTADHRSILQVSKTFAYSASPQEGIP